MNNGPVFITGNRRSGTTLLSNLIDRHENISVFVESFFIPRFYYAQIFYWPLTNTRNLLRLANTIVNEQSSRRNDLHLSSEALVSMKRRTYPGIVGTLLKNWAKEHGKTVWGDKSPGYHTKLDILHRLFPDARFIHIIRDGRGVWSSLKNLGWEKNVVRVAREWVTGIRKARRFAQAHGRENYLELRYEDLVQDPEKELRRIMKFLGQPYTEKLMSRKTTSHRNKAFVGWPGIHEKLDGTRPYRWRDVLSNEEIALFESQAEDLLRDLEYPLVHENPARTRFLHILFLRIASFSEESFGRLTRGLRLFVKYLYRSIHR